jgi:hypothetical protein
MVGHQLAHLKELDGLDPPALYDTALSHETKFTRRTRQSPAAIRLFLSTVPAGPLGDFQAADQGTQLLGPQAHGCAFAGGPLERSTLQAFGGLPKAGPIEPQQA